MRIILDNIAIGKKFYKEKKYIDALAFLYKALSMAELTQDLDNEIESREYIARSYYRMHRYKESLKQLEMLSNYPLSIEKQVEIISLIGICLHFMSKYEESMKKLQQLSTYNLEIAQRKMHINQGIVFYKLYKYQQKPTLQQALEHFNAALQYSLNDIVANKLYRNIGICLSELGKYSKALEMFNKSLEYSSNTGEVYNTKTEIALTYSRLGRFLDAEALFTDILAYLNNIEDFYEIGYTLLARGYNRLKMKEYEKAEDCVYGAIKSFLKVECFLEIGDCYNLLAKEYREINSEKAQIYSRQFQLYHSKFE